MPSKLEALCTFYRTIDPSVIKIEAKHLSMDELRQIKRIAAVDYCVFDKNRFKYRLSGLSHETFLYFLERHVRQEVNLCAYFHPEQNSVFAFNVDSVTPHGKNIKIYAAYLMQSLVQLGVFPLVIKSGHGYHFWYKLSEPIENRLLFRFMNDVSNRAIRLSKQKGISPDALRCTRYPRVNVRDISLRLFGSRHTATEAFSSVVVRIGAEDTLLGEEASWEYFERYTKESCVPAAQFRQICERARQEYALPQPNPVPAERS